MPRTATGPLFYAPATPYLARVVGVGEPASRLFVGLLAIAGGAMVASGVFHGLFAAPGTLSQAAWFVVLAVRGDRPGTN